VEEDRTQADVIRGVKAQLAASQRKIEELQEENRLLKLTRLDGMELRKARMMNKQHRRVNMHNLVDDDAELLFKVLCKTQRVQVTRKTEDEGKKLRNEQAQWKKNKPVYTKEEEKGE